MIIGFPFFLQTWTHPQEMNAAMAEEFLAHCTASITTCWYLLRGYEFGVVEQALSHYVPTLETLAYQPSKYQEIAAHLAAQARLLASLLALHQNNIPSKEHHCKQAVQLGQLAHDENLHVQALIPTCIL